MKHSSFWQATGFAVSTLLGTILHFLYDWTGKSTLAAVFSGVNESTWEHMKLLFWPLFLFAMVQRFFFRDQKSYWCVKLAGTALGLALIPVLFYTYNGAFGKSPDWINIAIFYISALLVFLFEWWTFRKKLLEYKHPQLALGAMIAIGILFVIFTFFTPNIPLFQDPVMGGYGVSCHFE